MSREKPFHETVSFQSSRKQDNVNLQETKQPCSSRRFLHYWATASSFFCSFCAISLISAGICWPDKLSENKRHDKFCDCLYGLLAASVALGAVAMILAPHKEVSKRDVSVDTESNRRVNSRTKKKCFEALEKSNTSQCSDNVETVATTGSSELGRTTDMKVPTPRVTPKSSHGNPFNVQQYKTDTRVSSERNRRLDRCYSSNPDRALIPYVNNQDPFSNLSLSSQRMPQVWSLTSPHSPSSNSLMTTEILESRRMRYFSGGSIRNQEEITVKKITTLYRYPESRLRSHQECLGEFAPTQGATFTQDHVSDVISKMETAKFFN